MLKSEKLLNFGVLLLRILMGFAMIMHGSLKFAKGATTLEAVGSALSHFGITGGYYFWGTVAGLSEIVGGALVLTGILFTPGCIILVCTLLVAIIHKAIGGNGFSSFSYPFEVASVFLSLIFIGPGKFTLKNYLFRLKK